MPHIITVCTANICRSPVAQLLLQERLGPGLGDDPVIVTSGGTRALVGEPMDARSRAALDERDPSDATVQLMDQFRASELTAARLVDADLVLTATRGHRDQAIRLAPRALKRTFTLLEFAELITGPDQGTVEPGSFGVLVAAAARRRTSVVGAHDIADPVGVTADEYRRVMAIIDDAVGRIAVGLRSVTAG